MLPVWAAMAKDYETAHPNVKIKITPLENEAFKAKLTTATQAGNPPDLFQSWGGGVLAAAGRRRPGQGHHRRRRAVDRHLLPGRDAAVPDRRQASTACRSTSAWSASGTTRSSSPRPASARRPTTWAELLDVVGKLKAAGIVPIALAGKEKWPGHFYWSYLAMRHRRRGRHGRRRQDRRRSTRPDFVTAGDAAQGAGRPRSRSRTGFLGAEYGSPDGQAATMGNGQAAMELMGQWAPSIAGRLLHQQEGHRRQARLLPVPGGRRRQGHARRGVRRRQRVRGRARTRRRRRSTS